MSNARPVDNSIYSNLGACYRRMNRNEQGLAILMQALDRSPNYAPALVNVGSNAEYHVVGWAAFHITDATATGTDGSISGWFSDVIWKGVVNPGGPFNPNIPDLGVHSVALID